QFQQRTILFPLDKSTHYDKYLKIVLGDLPTIDERLLNFIENKYPRRLQSIRCISESRNVRKIYSNHIFPILSDDSQWSTKSDAILIVYVIFIYKDLYSPQPDHFANEMKTLKNTLIIKTRQDKKWLDRQYYYDGRDKRIVKPDELEDMMEDPSGSIDEELLNRIHGSMIGMALGDALGAHVEFRTHAYLVKHPVTDFQEDEARGLKKGQSTDATSMALCLANSLIARRHFNPYDQLVRYKWWYKNGYMTSTGRCFDIGENTSQSFDEFQRRQESLAKDHQIPLEQLDFLSDYHLLANFNVDCSKIGAAGNGALMRLAPVPLFFHKWPIHAVEFSGRSGQITHGDPKAYDACRYYGALIVATLRGESKEQLLDNEFYVKHKPWFNGKRLHTDIEAIAKGSYKQRQGYDGGIRGNGYIVNTLQAALWAFWADENNFEKGVLAAVNLGDDTDTTAAIYGQLAGVYYGFKKLPENWRDQVYAKDFIKCVSKWIVYEGNQWQPEEPTHSTQQSKINQKTN
ncbi:unnamed protein product, partial [Rotaria sp. Silwood1]